MYICCTFPIFTGSLEICLQSLSNYPGPNISHATQTNVMIFDWRHSMHPCLLNFFVFRKMSIFVTKYVTEVSRRMCFEDSHLQFALLCRNPVRLDGEEVEGVPDRVLHRVKHLLYSLTITCWHSETDLLQPVFFHTSSIFLLFVAHWAHLYELAGFLGFL